MKNCGSGASNKIKTKLACILEADESTRMRMGNSIPQNHEDHIAGNGENSSQHYNLVHKFIPLPQAMKIPAAISSGGQGRGKLDKISAWNLTKVKSKKEVRRYSSFRIINGHLSSEKTLNWRQKHQKYKGRVVLRGDIVQDNSGSYAVFTEQRIFSISNDIISNLPVCDGQAADAISENSQIGVSRHFGFVNHDTNGQNHGPVWKDPVVPLERNLYGHPLAGLLWERQFEKILLKHGWEKIRNWECLFVHREKGFFSSVYVDDIKLAWKETKY